MLRRVWPLLSTHLRPIILLAVYLCVGLAFYTHVETKPCDEEPAETPALVGSYSYAEDETAGDTAGSGSVGSDGAPCAPVLPQESNCTTPWSAVDAVYFSMVTMSTVGYGDLSPSTWYSQLFTLFYIIVGIVAVFSQLSSSVLALFQPVFDLSRKAVTVVLPEPDPIDVDNDGTYDFVLPQPAWVFYTKGLLGPGLMVFALQLLFAGIFSAVEPAWGYGLALYHCFVTATTVGYGDVSITTTEGQVVASIHILLSVCLLGAIIGDIDAMRSKRAENLKRAEQLTQRFDSQSLKTVLDRLDTDGGGVAKYEFVVGMLQEAGLVQEADVKSYVALFEKADLTDDGKLSSEDITKAFEKEAGNRTYVKDAQKALKRSNARQIGSQIRNVAVAPASPRSPRVEGRRSRVSP